jgi:hypothetical protein
MNDLEMVTSKICSAREIIDSAIDALQSHEYEKAETLMSASYEYLEYYLQDFDNKFKLAWKETVIAEREYYEGSDLEYLSKHKEPLSCDKDDPSPECRGAWTSFWEEGHSKYYYEYDRNDPDKSDPFSKEKLDKEIEEIRKDGGYEWTPEVKRDKVKRWILPVEETKIAETDETEYFVSFPDDLLEAADLQEGDQVEWVDLGDGSYLLKKVTKPLRMDEC